MRCSMPAGALRSGTERSTLWIVDSNLSGSWEFILKLCGEDLGGGAAPGKDLRERGPGPEDVGLHLRQRHAEAAGDLVVGKVLEVVQDQGDALVVGQLAERLL